jgi:hypothetical protein
MSIDYMKENHNCPFCNDEMKGLYLFSHLKDKHIDDTIREFVYVIFDRKFQDKGESEL